MALTCTTATDQGEDGFEHAEREGLQLRPFVWHRADGQEVDLRPCFVYERRGAECRSCSCGATWLLPVECVHLCDNIGAATAFANAWAGFDYAYILSEDESGPPLSSFGWSVNCGRTALAFRNNSVLSTGLYQNSEERLVDYRDPAHSHRAVPWHFGA